MKMFCYMLIGLFLFSVCERGPLSPEDRTLQKSFHEVLIDDFSNFKVHFIDGDMSVWIFSYQLPPSLSAQDALAILRKRITTIDKNYAVTSESKAELVMRRPINYIAPDGFDEYRLFVNQKGGIIVMFSSVDSAVKIKNHQFYVEKFHKVQHEHL